MVRFQLVITLLSSSLQASAQKVALEIKEVSANVYVVMRYWHPFIEEAVHQRAEEKIGVLLLNLGGPDTLYDVQPFLLNLFADPDIIRIPRLFRFLQCPLVQFISVLQALKSKERYAAIGGDSPLQKITDEQASALKLALEIKEVPANVYVVMRYWHPFIEEAVHQTLIFPDCQLLSLNPCTNGKVTSKPMESLIEQELHNFTKPEEVIIFFSPHGVPVCYVENASDPYRDRMEEFIFLIMKEVKGREINNDHTLDYQAPPQQQQTPGGSAASTDTTAYGYNQPSATGYNQGKSYSQDGYDGYHAPAAQSGYLGTSYDQQQGYSDTPSYGNVPNPTSDSHNTSHGKQGDGSQAPAPAQSSMGQQGYQSGQQPSTTPSYPSQDSTQAGYGMTPTSQGGYGTQSTIGYGTQPAAGYGPTQSQKPPTSHPAYGQPQQSPTTQDGYAKPPPL
uniref:Ferrochelatase n=1 Tax=Solanum lycopersicum TaxID=4081 RepID=A0A3Q7HN24_SOLLC